MINVKKLSIIYGRQIQAVNNDRRTAEECSSAVLFRLRVAGNGVM